jgi:hypothetical protein
MLRQLPALDLFVLVSRLGHPLPSRERALAHALSDLATLSKVLFVGLKGEEATRDDIAELGAYAKIVMQRQGFSGTRFLAAATWLPNAEPGNVPVAQAIEDPLAFAGLASEDLPRDIADSAREAALSRLLRDIRAIHPDRDRPLPAVSEEDALQLTRDLDRFMKKLGEELTQPNFGIHTRLASLNQLVKRASARCWSLHLKNLG